MSPDLMSAANRLNDRIDDLTKTMTVSSEQAKRMRVLTRVTLALVGFMALAMIALGVLVYLNYQNSQANKHSQVTACQNANESREANQTLWTFLLDATPKKTDTDRINFERLHTWIAQLYAPHDCSDLSHKYVLPPPPKLEQPQ